MRSTRRATRRRPPAGPPPGASPPRSRPSRAARCAAGFAQVLREGVAAGELPPQNVELTAAALVGALGEALVGPLSPVADDVDADALVADLVAFCLRSVTEETH